jgi:hypothetical protein
MLAEMRPRGCRFALLVVVYVGLDLANPLMPGALNFNPDECVEALQRGSDLRAPIAAAQNRVDASPAASDLPLVHRPPRAVPRPMSEWWVQEREAHVVAPDPPPSEEH